MDSYVVWTVLTCVLCGVICSLLGVWLVSMRLSMLGDAISHSVLPGLVLVFIVFQTRSSIPMLAGASAMGLMTIWLMRLLTNKLRIKNDASMGIIFTTLFALGVVLITRYASQVDLDPGCVLYGSAELVAIDTVYINGYEIPRALTIIVPSLVIIFLSLYFFHQRFLIMAFDKELSKSLGLFPNLYYYFLMGLVAIAVVASFESVGSILVIAMLTGPATAIKLLYSSIDKLYIYSVLFSLSGSLFGCLLGFTTNTSIAGCISIVIGIQFLIFSMIYLCKRHVQKLKIIQ